MAEEIRLSKSFIETELPQAPPLYVSVYLMTLAVGQDAKKVAERLKATETDVLYAWGYWKGKGYLQEEKKQETEETEQAKKGNFDLADGFYKGSGTGFAGTVSVSVEIKDKSIVAINILSTQDDEAFFNRAKGVIDKIIAGQTLDVDVVSGATYSSNGIISAVKNAESRIQAPRLRRQAAAIRVHHPSKLWMIPIRHGKTAPIMAAVPDLMVKCRLRW